MSELKRYLVLFVAFVAFILAAYIQGGGTWRGHHNLRKSLPAIVVKRAFFAWEAAVLPLNYARKPLIMFYNSDPPSRFPLSNPCQL
jgi:hypothetical protein